jgi:RNA polymerase sigma-70 factor (ECF subfamily)
MEERLIKKVIAGDQKATKRLYQKYQSRLLNFILQKVKRPEDAEEILQETMISVLDSLPLFRGDSSLYTFICSIARHEIADFYRRKKIKTFVFSRLPQLEDLVSQALSPERVLEEREFKKEILRTLKSLTEGYAKILRLKYIDGLSYKEIAKKLKKSVKAVESKLARARDAFAEAYLASFSS